MLHTLARLVRDSDAARHVVLLDRTYPDDVLRWCPTGGHRRPAVADEKEGW